MSYCKNPSNQNWYKAYCMYARQAVRILYARGGLAGCCMSLVWDLKYETALFCIVIAFLRIFKSHEFQVGRL